MNGKIIIEKIVDQKDGSAIVYVDFDNEFKESFMASQNLKRFSKKRFQDFFTKAIENFIKKETKGNNTNDSNNNTQH